MKVALLAIAFMIISANGRAQNYIDLVQLNALTTPPNSFVNSTAESVVTEFNFTFNTPVKLSPKLVLLPGFYADRISARLSPLSFNRNTFYTVNPRLGLNIRHSEKWSGSYLFLPKLSSDLERISRKDYQFGGIAIINYQKNEGLKYKFGLYYNTELFGPFFVPLLGFYYLNHNQKWEIKATLPFAFNANYRFLKDWQAGFQFSAFVRSFYLHQGEFSQQYLVKATNEPALFLQYEVSRGILLKIVAGYSIARSYRTYQTADRVDWGFTAFRFGDQRQQTNVDFEDGLVFQLGLTYRYYLQ